MSTMYEAWTAMHRTETCVREGSHQIDSSRNQCDFPCWHMRQARGVEDLSQCCFKRAAQAWRVAVSLWRIPKGYRSGRLHDRPRNGLGQDALNAPCGTFLLRLCFPSHHDALLRVHSSGLLLPTFFNAAHIQCYEPHPSLFKPPISALGRAEAALLACRSSSLKLHAATSGL